MNARRLFRRIFAGELHCRWCHRRIWRWQLVKSEKDGYYSVMHAACERDFLADLRRPLVTFPIVCECGADDLTHDGCPLE